MLYPLYLLLWLVAADYFFFWRPWVAQMRERAVPPRAALPEVSHVDPTTMARLGSFTNDRTACFVRFPEDKAENTTRLCAFGDSFTYGAEVADGHEYPALLQAMLRQAGYAGVEVLNFGVSWHGFHQSYALWHDVGQRYHCDVVLLGPGSFQYERDTTFNHTGGKAPYYLHARYVLDGDGVRLVEVPDALYADRFADYYRFLPRWRYLRYDRNIAPAIQSILPEKRRLPNPLYYSWLDMQTEALATYERLLAKLADEAPQIVLLHENEKLVEVARKLDRPNLVAGRSFGTARFPYRAPESHYSSFGNHLVARQFFHLLTGDSAAALATVETSDPPETQPPAGLPTPLALSHYDRVELRAGDDPIGFAVPATAEPHLLGPGSASIFKERKVTGLLGLRQRETRLVDTKLVEIDFILHPGDDVVLRATADSRREERIGEVRMLDPSINLGVVDLDEVRNVGFELFLGDETIDPESLAVEGTPVELLVGGQVALRGTVARREIRLEPMPGHDVRHFRVSAGQFADLDAPGRSPQFDLVVAAGDRATRVPLALWKKTEVPMPSTDKPLPKRLAQP